MIQKSDVCVLIPAYNEEKNIERVIADVRTRGWAVLIVDDGSSDSTSEKVRASGVAAVFSSGNQGKGASLRKGLEWLRQTPFRAAVLMDADGQHDADEIHRFVEAIDAGADLVIGDRMASPKNMPFIRVLTNRIMSGMLSAASGQRVPDTQCGYRALGRRAIDTIELKTDRFETESEMILRAADAGLRIVSVPVRCVYGDEKSHIHPARDTARFLGFLFRYLSSRKT